MPFVTLDNLIHLWILSLYYRLKSAMQSQIDILPLWVRFLARAQLKMLRKLLVWPKGSMQTLTDKNLDWNLKGNFSRMRLLLKILDWILVSLISPKEWVDIAQVYVSPTMFWTVSTNIAQILLINIKKVSKKYYHKEIPTSGASCSSKAN